MFWGKKPKRFSFIFQKIFVDISLENPHDTSLVHLKIEEFKGLVVYAKCNCDFYESELGFSFSYFPFLFR